MPGRLRQVRELGALVGHRSDVDQLNAPEFGPAPPSPRRAIPWSCSRSISRPIVICETSNSSASEAKSNLPVGSDPGGDRGRRRARSVWAPLQGRPNV
jgi:hypothetical protein